jgi:hypothetical protein
VFSPSVLRGYVIHFANRREEYKLDAGQNDREAILAIPVL